MKSKRFQIVQWKYIMSSKPQIMNGYYKHVLNLLEYLLMKDKELSTSHQIQYGNVCSNHSQDDWTNSGSLAIRFRHLSNHHLVALKWY